MRTKKLEHLYAIALATKGSAFKFVGRLREAMALYQEALELFQKLADLRWERRTLGRLGRCTLDCGNLEESLSHLSKALDSAEKAGDMEQIAIFSRYLSEAYWYQNRFEAARSAARNAIHMYTLTGDVSENAINQLMLAKAEYALGNLDVAKTIVIEAYGIFTRLQFKPYILRAEELLEMFNTEIS